MEFVRHWCRDNRMYISRTHGTNCVPDRSLHAQAEAAALRAWHEDLTRVCGRDILTIELCN